MEFDSLDQDMIKLLTKLKGIEREYPEKLLTAQRQSYLKQIKELHLGINTNTGIKNKAKSTKPPNGPSVAGTLLEIALLATILTEASVLAYFYSGKLKDFFHLTTTGSGIREVTPAPAIPTSPEFQDISPSPAITSTLPSTTAETSPVAITVTLSGTPFPAADQLNSTPDANKGNNGHHYGQTPKPQRTKENSGNNDKPPKDKNKPPKDQPKPDKPK